MNLKNWAYIKHYEELEIKTLTKRKRSITNLNNSNEELKRIRKELKRLNKGAKQWTTKRKLLKDTFIIKN